MKIRNQSHPISDVLSYVFTLIPLLLGVVVLIGWYTHQATLIQVNKAFVPMQYNTALGFFLCGLTLYLILTKNIKIVSFLSVLVLLIGILTLIEYIFQINLGIDELFMKHYVSVETSTPGRMAPNTALCFTLTGFIFFLHSFKLLKTNFNKIIGGFGILVFLLGLIAAIGYFIEFEAAYGWGNLTRMAIHTAVGFILLSLGVLFWIWNNLKRELYFMSSIQGRLIFMVIFPVIIIFLVVSFYNIRILEEKTELRVDAEYTNICNELSLNLFSKSVHFMLKIYSHNTIAG